MVRVVLNQAHFWNNRMLIYKSTDNKSATLCQLELEFVVVIVNWFFGDHKFWLTRGAILKMLTITTNDKLETLLGNWLNDSSILVIEIGANNLSQTIRL